jgi:hypothetical protein
LHEKTTGVSGGYRLIITVSPDFIDQVTICGTLTDHTSGGNRFIHNVTGIIEIINF